MIGATRSVEVILAGSQARAAGSSIIRRQGSVRARTHRVLLYHEPPGGRSFLALFAGWRALDQKSSQPLADSYQLKADCFSSTGVRNNNIFGPRLAFRPSLGDDTHHPPGTSPRCPYLST